MEGFPKTAALFLLTVFSICNAVSFPRNGFNQEDDEVPRTHVLPKTREYTRAVEIGKFDDLQKALLRASREKKLGRESERKLQTKREGATEMSWEDFLRRQRAIQNEREREKEFIIRELLTDITKQRSTVRVPSYARSASAATKTFTKSLPKNIEDTLHRGSNHREREKEVEIVRNDNHGRRERERIHKEERERKHRMINNQLVNELEREMRGRRQRVVSVGGRVREMEERIRQRERSRAGV